MTTLKEGMKGEDVARLQQQLKDLGFDPGNIDGDFGRGTEAAVINFQKSKKLFPDGIVGPKTLKALGLEFTDEVGAFSIRSS